MKKDINLLINSFESEISLTQFPDFSATELIEIINHYLKILNEPKLDRAISSALHLFPENTELKIEISRLVLRANFIKKSLKLIEGIPDSGKFKYDIWLIKGICSYYYDIEEDGKELLESVVNTKGLKSFDGLLAKGWLMLIDDEFEEAYDHFKQIIKKDFLNHCAVNELFNLNLYNEKQSETIRFFEQLIQKSPYSAMLWMYLGMAYSADFQDDKAISAFEVVLAMSTELPNVYYHLSLLVDYENEAEKALDYLEKAIQNGYETSAVYHLMGDLYLQLNNYAKARKCFKKTIEFDSSTSESWFDTGMTFIHEKQFLKALPYLKESINLSPEISEYWLEYANVLALLFRTAEAEEAYLNAIKYADFEHYAYIDYCLFLHNQKRTEQAISILLKEINKANDVPSFYYLLAGFYFDTRQMKKGAKNLATAINLDPFKKEVFTDNFPYLCGIKPIQDILQSQHN